MCWAKKLCVKFVGNDLVTVNLRKKSAVNRLVHAMESGTRRRNNDNEIQVTHKKIFSARVRKGPCISEDVTTKAAMQKNGVCSRCRKRIPRTDLTKARQNIMDRSMQRKNSKKNKCNDSLEDSMLPSTDSDSGYIMSCSGDDVSLRLGDSARSLSTVCSPKSGDMSLLRTVTEKAAYSRDDAFNRTLDNVEDIENRHCPSSRHRRSETHPPSTTSKTSLGYDSRGYPAIRSLKDLRKYMHMRRQHCKDNISLLDGLKGLDNDSVCPDTALPEQTKEISSSAWLKADLNAFVCVFPKGKSFIKIMPSISPITL